MPGRVIFMAPEVPTVAGGVRTLSRYVSLLVAAGVDAYLWCPTPGYRYTWFDDVVPMASGLELDLDAADLLVVPEPGVLPGRDPAPGARKAILNQNHFYTLAAWSDPSEYPGWNPAPSIWATSTESVEVLARMYPAMPPSLIPTAIDTDLFKPNGERTRSIAFMPRKRPQEATLLKRLLSVVDGAHNVELYELGGLSETEVAKVLSRASVFVALGLFEGFGMPVAEALSAGCLVVGYPAGGGTELFAAPGAFAVPDQRPLLLADEAVRALDLPDADDLRRAARQWVVDRYSAKAVLPPLLAAVEAARTKPGAAARAVHFSVWKDEIMAAIGALTGAQSPKPARAR